MTRSYDAGERVVLGGLLSSRASFRLLIDGRYGVDEINVLIRRLEFDRAILAKAEDEVPDAPPTTEADAA